MKSQLDHPFRTASDVWLPSARGALNWAWLHVHVVHVCHKAVLPSCPTTCCLCDLLAAAATFILINVRSTVVGYLEEQRADPTLPSEQVPQLSQ